MDSNVANKKLEDTFDMSTMHIIMMDKNISNANRTTLMKDIEKVDDLIVVAVSNEAGVHLVSDKTQRQFFLFGHWEYDRETLAKEYFRDKEKGLPIQIPYSYFPDDDPENKPIFNWSCSANLLYSNWLNYCIYQKTPYDLNELEPLGTAQ